MPRRRIEKLGPEHARHLRAKTMYDIGVLGAGVGVTAHLIRNASRIPGKLPRACIMGGIGIGSSFLYARKRKELLEQKRRIDLELKRLEAQQKDAEMRASYNIR